MTTAETKHRSLKRQERRIFAVTLAVCALIAFTVYSCIYGAAYVAFWSYSPKEGDILFQSLPRNRLVNAIEGVSDSPYSHCGIVSKQNGKWVVQTL